MHSTPQRVRPVGIYPLPSSDRSSFVSLIVSRRYYFTGDGARRDKDGYIWITGRVDDVVNVSGHRIGTAEVESALVSHPKCAEAAVVGVEHPVKGQVRPNVNP
eukprot:7279150-Pyramimonas_sp.AAC.2